MRRVFVQGAACYVEDDYIFVPARYGTILAAGGVTEIAGIRTRPLVSELCGYAGLCPFDQGKVLPHANKWLSARLRRGRLACHRLLGLLRDFYKRKRALGKDLRSL